MVKNSKKIKPIPSYLIKENPELEYCYYSFEIDTLDSFSDDKNKKMKAYSLIKSTSEELAKAKVKETYKELDLPIFNIKLISKEKL